MRSQPPAPAEARPWQASPNLSACAVVAALAIALLLGARAFAAMPLLVAGAGFLSLLVLAPLWVLSAGAGTRVERRLSARRVVENEVFEANVLVRRGLIGLPGPRLHDPLAGPEVGVGEHLALLGGRRRVDFRVLARLPRRGRHVLAPPTLELGDGLGLMRFSRRGRRGEDVVLVLPRVEPVSWIGRAERRASFGHAERLALDPIGAGEVDGLRAYMPGTPASRIHWPALARHPNPPLLLERRLVSQSETRPLIVLDTRLESDAQIGLLDDAVRATASLAVELARQGGCNVLLGGERVPTPLGPELSGWSAVHTRLAVLEPERNLSRGPALRPEAVRGSLLYVAARSPSSSRLRMLGSLGGAVTQVMLVLPRELALSDEPPALAVSGCVGQLLRARRRRRLGEGEKLRATA